VTHRGILPDEQVLAAATKREIQGAGGLDVCARETGLSETHLSRCSSPNMRDSITIRDVATIQAIGHGGPGHPYILHALARLAGGVFVMLPEPFVEPITLQLSVLELSTELGDVAQAVRAACCAGSAGGAAITEAESAAIAEHLDDLDRASARLRHQLQQIGKGDDAPPQ
jgi:hypothetical protein